MMDKLPYLGFLLLIVTLILLSRRLQKLYTFFSKGGKIDWTPRKRILGFLEFIGLLLLGFFGLVFFGMKEVTTTNATRTYTYYESGAETIYLSNKSLTIDHEGSSEFLVFEEASQDIKDKESGYELRDPLYSVTANDVESAKTTYENLKELMTVAKPKAVTLVETKDFRYYETPLLADRKFDGKFQDIESLDKLKGSNTKLYADLVLENK